MRLPTYEQQQRERLDRRRAIGGGRPCDQPVALRVALVLTYLRLHIPQEAVARLYGATQTDVSRELRRLLLVLREALPSSEVWEVVETQGPLPEAERLDLADLADGRALIDATEQRVYRSQDSAECKRHYSEKKAFTLKTKMVTDGDHHIVAISVAVPGTQHDKSLSDDLQTIERLPDGCESDADKGYQGLAQQVS